jgi:hypothetical protein
MLWIGLAIFPISTVSQQGSLPMKKLENSNRTLKMAVAMALATALVGCGKKAEAPVTPPATATPAVAPAPSAEQLAQATAENSKSLDADSTTWTPEQLEELTAPIALYPDPVLDQVLVASTNPQEVLDGGNWLLLNSGLKGKALDQAAEQAGFTPSMRALFPFPETVDMMAQEMAWTQELGQAYVNDQQGVLDSIQRLRKQAEDVGNLKSSPQMTVSKQSEGGNNYVAISPPSPEVIYVPRYDPVAVYAPAPAPTTNTVVVQEGHSTSTLVTTGLLAFGAGMLVNELFDNNDNNCRRNYYNYHCRNNNYYGGGYWGNSRPYYPPYPYRPVYGNNFYPGHNYNRPPNYNSGWNHNGNNNININGDININTGGNRPNRPGGGGYWDRYPNDRPSGSNNGVRPRPISSPITQARPNRPELTELNKRQPKAMPSDVKRPSVNANSNDWKGQSSYAGSKGPSNGKPTAGMADKARDQAKKSPKVQGSYAGAKPAVSRDVQRPQMNKPNDNTRDVQRPQINKPNDKSRDVQRPQINKPNDNTRDVQRPQMNKPNDKIRDVQRPDMNKPNTRDVQRPQMDKPNKNTRDMQRPNSGQGDRGYGQSRPSPSSRPQQMDRPSPSSRPERADRQSPSGGRNRNSAMSGASRGGNDRAASQRGKQSMPQGAGARIGKSKR